MSKLNDCITNSDFKGFKIMHNGSGYFQMPFTEGMINLRTRTGPCNNWDGDINDRVSLDLCQHEYGVDAYIFMILEIEKKQGLGVGWILFDDLLKNSETIIENETVYLTIPIRALRKLDELTELTKGNKK